MMQSERGVAWQHCERLTRQFYRALDRREAETIESMVTADCHWVRGGTTAVGPAAIRQVLDGRSRDLKTRHLVCNAVAVDTLDGGIVVGFDLLYLADAAGQTAKPPAILSGTDLYRLENNVWKLAHKQASLQF